MRDADATVTVLTALKDVGVRIAIDDFGTGYSSLAYLRRFPVDALKIDQSFIKAIAESRAAGELIHTLVSLGKALRTRDAGRGHRAARRSSTASRTRAATAARDSCSPGRSRPRRSRRSSPNTWRPYACGDPTPPPLT